MVVGVIFKLIYFGFPGLPDGLPDAVCPAAMLQHVFRPPQQQRETNAAVHRPLAPPRAPRTRQTCSLLSPHPFHSRYTRKHNQEKTAGDDGYGGGKNLDQKKMTRTYLYSPFVLTRWMAELKRETALQKVKALTVLDKLQNGQEAAWQCKEKQFKKTVLTVLTIFCVPV